jgi:aldehyde dehydrogenase (NAD+)
MDFLQVLGITNENSGAGTGSSWLPGNEQKIASFSPVDGQLIASVRVADREQYDMVIQKAQEAFLQWRLWPAPKRGEVVRQIAEALRKHKEALGQKPAGRVRRSAGND